MTFNAAVSGLKAADIDLSVIGNNIANGSTTGFKYSRAIFADVYANSSLGSATVGSGVSLLQAAQQFNQGNVAFTNSPLDLAVNGSGFFILDNDGASEYTRAGVFGVDQTGTIVNPEGKQLQGFSASDTGAISGNMGSLSIESTGIDPRRTVEVDAILNLDATESDPRETGTIVQTLGADIGVAQSNVTTNGYVSETFTVTLSDGSTRELITAVNDSASILASNLNALPEVSATASTTATISAVNDLGSTTPMTVALNNVTIATSTGAGSITPQSLAVAINNLTSTTLRGITASFDNAAGTVTVTSNDGDDLSFNLNNTTDAGDTLTVTGPAGADVVLLGDGTLSNATVGGTVSITLEDEAEIESTGTALLGTTVLATPFLNNRFLATDQDTYNHSTSVTIFDSIGSPHTLSMYFVKSSSQNQWDMHVLVDGQDVGDPNVALPEPDNLLPTEALFSLVFNENGTLDESASDAIEISYWSPLNADGEPNGALDGTTVANGATFPVTDITTSSNFVIDLTGTTQFGSAFSVNDMSQDGYSTGQLSGIEIASSGTIFARYSNGQSRALGQVALANFRNEQGLQPVGGTSWLETFSSGNPVIGSPGTSSLGVVQSGALEESNVELSEELVNLIEAQRNFQANAKTIQTADTVTQAIINIR